MNGFQTRAFLFFRESRQSWAIRASSSTPYVRTDVQKGKLISGMAGSKNFGVQLTSCDKGIADPVFRRPILPASRRNYKSGHQSGWTSSPGRSADYVAVREHVS